MTALATWALRGTSSSSSSRAWWWGGSWRSGPRGAGQARAAVAPMPCTAPGQLRHASAPSCQGVWWGPHLAGHVGHHPFGVHRRQPRLQRDHRGRRRVAHPLQHLAPQAPRRGIACGRAPRDVGGRPTAALRMRKRVLRQRSDSRARRAFCLRKASSRAAPAPCPQPLPRPPVLSTQARSHLSPGGGPLWSWSSAVSHARSSEASSGVIRPSTTTTLHASARVPPGVAVEGGGHVWRRARADGAARLWR